MPSVLDQFGPGLMVTGFVKRDHKYFHQDTAGV